MLDWAKLPAAFSSLGKKIASSSLITGGSVDIKQANDGSFSIIVPEADRTEPVTIVKLVLAK